MDLHLAATIWSIHLERDHDRRDDFVLALLHVADSDMNGVPGSAFDIIGLVHDLLDKEAGIESLLLFCIVEVD